jgi:catalase (peroxidase I)
MTTEAKCPFASGAANPRGRAATNAHWWPEQLQPNIRTSAPGPDPMGDGFNYAKSSRAST